MSVDLQTVSRGSEPASVGSMQTDPLLVDVGQEPAVLFVQVILQGVVPILGLDQTGTHTHTHTHTHTMDRFFVRIT